MSNPSDEETGEDHHEDLDEFLDWLCWVIATEGERFHPPTETADECMEAVAENYEDQPDEERIEARGWERGQHTRAWSTAVERFCDMKKWGLDPVERTERHIAEAREDDLDLSDVDWTWLEESRYSEVKG